MTAAEQDTLLATAGRLASAAGLAPPISLERLAGGKNNRVFRVTLASGGSAVLKSYHADRRDPRDRLDSEYRFLSYADPRSAGRVPRPLARDDATRSALYSFLPGHRLAAGEVGPAHVTAAADFIRDLNAPPREALSLPPASESCFTLAAHLATVEGRVGRLSTLDPDAPLRDQAQALVAERLMPAWRDVRRRAEREAGNLGIDPQAKIAKAEICVSPSDFGFHNALCEGGTQVRFVDFEYAGHDDPAKLACDFFCQPEVPVPLALFESFVERLTANLGLADIHRARCRMLLDAYRIKWVCIILNEFLPVDATRRAFAGSGPRLERCARQLAKAAEQLSLLGSA